MLFNVLLIM